MKTLPAKSFFFEKDKNLILKKFKSILDGKSFLSQYKYAEKFAHIPIQSMLYHVIQAPQL